ncbi:unnamed protein product [Amaranthus hypochondriacus]
MKSPFLRVVLVIILSVVLVLNSAYGSFSFNEDSAGSASTGTVGRLVKKDERMPIVSTEFGEISAVDIDDGSGSGSGSGIGRDSYHLQFITLEPNSLFLPVLLHADMVFYVQTGSGKLSWTEGDNINKVSLRRGDVYRLKSGTLFYIHSSLEAKRPRLRIIAIFANPDEEKLQGPSIGPYSSINDLVRGFDKSVLQAAFQVPEEVIEELTSATDTPAIVHAERKKKNFWQKELLFVDALFGIQSYGLKEAENKKKKTFNFFKEDPDFKNYNGWSTVVTKHDLHALHGSHISVFMANLTKSSMMGPHWNPLATEVSVVLEGEGMVRVVCPSAPINKECKNSRFRIEEGDVFTIPRFHPMAQTSFNDKSLVFMGFSTTSKKNHPQFLVGKASVLQTISKSILSSSFNVSKTTIEKLLDAQGKAIILDCTSCAETQEMLMEEEIEKEKQEEEEKRREEEEQERKRREEEERRRREEEEKKRREEEEERRRREEEEQKRREEEEQRRREEEEQRRREEEEQRRREEEEQKRREEEEQRRHEEEEQKRREEEEEQRRHEEEEQRRREEEEQRRIEEEEQRRREEEEERQREEEEQRGREEEEERQREEEAQQRQEEEERRREEERREQEEEWQRREEEKREQEEEWQRQEERREREEEQQQEEERREQEEEWQRREEERREQEEWQKQEEEEESRREQHEQQWQEERRREQEEEWKRWEEGERGEQEETRDWDWERSENKNWRKFPRYTTKV